MVEHSDLNMGTPMDESGCGLNFKDFVMGLDEEDAEGGIKILRDSALQEISNTLREEYKDTTFFQKCCINEIDIVGLVEEVVDSCIVRSLSSPDYIEIYSEMYEEEIEALCTCMPDFEFGGVVNEYKDEDGFVRWTDTLWKYSPEGNSSAVELYATYLRLLKDRGIIHRIL